MKHVWKRIEDWLSVHAPEAFAGLNGPASQARLEETERTLGVRLPDDVRASYLLHDGQDTNAPCLLLGWEFLPLAEIVAQWSIWKELLDQDTFADFESEADGLLVRKDWWNAGWIPFTHDGGGDHFCIDLAPGPHGTAGQIIEMWHDDGIRPVMASSFSALLGAYADSLEAGDYVYHADFHAVVHKDDI
ncbi:SMI1/KNR4 family protein [Pseudomonas sp. TE3610]